MTIEKDPPTPDDDVVLELDPVSRL